MISVKPVSSSSISLLQPQLARAGEAYMMNPQQPVQASDAVTPQDNYTATSPQTQDLSTTPPPSLQPKRPWYKHPAALPSLVAATATAIGSFGNTMMYDAMKDNWVAKVAVPALTASVAIGGLTFLGKKKKAVSQPAQMPNVQQQQPPQNTIMSSSNDMSANNPATVAYSSQ